MKISRFLLITLCVFLLLVVAYFGLFRYQLGSAMSSEWWVKSVYDYKMHAAKQSASPKLIVLGGSNAMFGIDSQVLQNKLDMPVINLSIHAGLDPHFLTTQLRNTVGKGDVVVMPLEYEFYSPSDEYSGWFVSNMMAWGNDIYIDRLPVSEYLSFLKAVSVSDVWKGVLSVGSPSKLIPTEQVIQEVSRRNARGKARYEGYSHKSLTLQGDMLPDTRPHKRVLNIVDKEGDPYLKPLSEISPRLLESLAEVRTMLDAHGAQLIITWPVSVRNPAYDLSTPRDQKRVESFAALLEKNQIDIQCEPALFNFHFALFHDNRYHLNRKGALLRSVNLADCVSEVLNGSEPAEAGFRHQESIGKLRFQERKVLSGK